MMIQLEVETKSDDEEG